MEIIPIHLQGLNYSIPNRQAGAGICRELENLYPSGYKEKPMWSPVHMHEEYLNVIGNLPWPYEGTPPTGTYAIIDAYPWHRANRPSMLLYLRNNPITGEDWICAREIDRNGSLVADKSEVGPYYKWPQSNNNQVSFAQLGDQLFVCLTRNDEPYDFVQIFETETGTICLPYNVPLFPVANVFHKKVEGKTNVFTGLTGFMFAWELLDGTIVKPTQRQLITSNPSDGLLTARVFKTALSDNWKNIIRGVAVFMTDSFIEANSKSAKQNYFDSAVLKKVTLLEKVFTEQQDFSIEMTLDEFKTIADLYDEDNLTARDVFPRVIYAYNGKLICADLANIYSPPSEIDGSSNVSVVTPINEKPTITKEEISKDPADTLAFNKTVLEWDSYGNKVDIERAYELVARYGTYGDTYVRAGKITDFYPQFSKFEGFTITDKVNTLNPGDIPPSAKFYSYSAKIQFRLRSIYSDGTKSDWVYSTKVIR